VWINEFSTGVLFAAQQDQRGRAAGTWFSSQQIWLGEAQTAEQRVDNTVGTPLRGPPTLDPVQPGGRDRGLCACSIRENGGQTKHFEKKTDNDWSRKGGGGCYKKELRGAPMKKNGK